MASTLCLAKQNAIWPISMYYHMKNCPLMVLKAFKMAKITSPEAFMSSSGRPIWKSVKLLGELTRDCETAGWIDTWLWNDYILWVTFFVPNVFAIQTSKIRLKKLVWNFYVQNCWQLKLRNHFWNIFKTSTFSSSYEKKHFGKVSFYK